MPRQRPGTPRRSLRPKCAAIALVGLGLCGCTRGVRSHSPERAVAAYAAALREGNYSRAEALAGPAEGPDTPPLSEEAAQHSEEVRALADALDSPVASVAQRATVTLRNGTRVELTRGKDGWRVRVPSPRIYDQSTPRAALVSFLRAMRYGRWDRLLSLMPEAARAGLTPALLGERVTSQQEDLERMLALLAASVDQPIERVGDRATMPYGDRFAVQFVREGEQWKIEDPE